MASNINGMLRPKTLPPKTSTKVVQVKAKQRGSTLTVVTDVFDRLKFPAALINIIICMISLEMAYLPALMQQEVRATYHEKPLIDLCRLTNGDIITTSDDHIELYESRKKNTQYVSFEHGGALCTLPHASFAATQLGNIQLFDYDETDKRYKIVRSIDNGKKVTQLRLLDDDKLQAFSKTDITTWDIETRKAVCKPIRITQQAQEACSPLLGILHPRISQNPQKIKIMLPHSGLCLMVERFKSPVTNIVSLDQESFAALSGNKILTFSIDARALKACNRLEVNQHAALQHIIKDLERLGEKTCITIKDQESAPVYKKIDSLPITIEPLRTNLRNYLNRLTGAHIIVTTPQNCHCIIS